MRFRNRTEAGRIIAERLLEQLSRAELSPAPYVIALPRGGVPVAREVASYLNAPLETLAVRKIGAPENPEYGIGAITESGYFWINPDAVATPFGEADLYGADEMERVITRELGQVRKEVDLYRGGRVLPDFRGKTVIIVDDGIATGATAVVASRYLKSLGAATVIIAAPVCARDSLKLLEREANRVVVADAPEVFLSVGSWYEDFSQITDDEVIAILASSRSRERETPLPGDLKFPAGFRENPKGVVIFAHGSGSSRFSPRNRRVAGKLNDAGFATLLFDLLTEDEEADRTRVFDIPFLAGRLARTTVELARELKRRGLETEIPIGYFGASTGAAAALWAAADLGTRVSAVVSRGGRPDLAASRLSEVTAPTLLIVGSFDHPVVEMNERALKRLHAGQMALIDGATHLFEEPGTLDQVAEKAALWFEAHLSKAGTKGGAGSAARAA